MKFTIAVVTTLAMSTCNVVFAQSWPSKPIRMVVGFPPGGSVDIAARAVANHLSESLHQPVVVDNRSGAAGTVASQLVVRAEPDGYSVLVGTGTVVSTPHLYKLGFDPMKDLAPIIQLSRQPVVLAAHPSLGVNTLSELVNLARRKPGIAYATSGAGTGQHMIAEWFAKTAGIQLTHVPYKGGGPAITELVGGQVPLGSLGSTPLIPHYKAGRLRLLAQSTRVRAPALPDVPTYGEQGMRGLQIEQWIGLFAPTGTPDRVIERLNVEVAKVLAKPTIRSRFATDALEPVGASSREFSKLVREDYEKYGRLLSEMGIRVD